jgi:hypothetical protein
MTILLRRQFAVDLPIAQAWQHLARAERWPRRAEHIRHLALQPPGGVGPSLSNGVKSTLTMTELNLHRNWTWVGRLLWLTIAFDHRFEARSPTQTRLMWIVAAQELGVSVFRRLLAQCYGQHLDRAMPLLVEEMQA